MQGDLGGWSKVVTDKTLSGACTMFRSAPQTEPSSLHLKTRKKNVYIPFDYSADVFDSTSERPVSGFGVKLTYHHQHPSMKRVTLPSFISYPQVS
jgi:hypothetical protein